MNTLKGAFFFITGFLTCPCHLPVTLPLLLTLTAGTALGVFLANNVWVIVALSTIYFLVALALGWHALATTERSTCPKPSVPRAISESELNLE